jgi:hypothetical protein
MYFQAKLLPFALGIPIMQLDHRFFNKNKHPIANLFESYSARWGCIKYYMATAADVGEGCRLNMDSFLRGVTDHDEHSVVYTTRNTTMNTTTNTTTTNHPPTTTNSTRTTTGTNDQRTTTQQQQHQLPQQLVKIDMQDAVDTQIPNVPKDESQVWRFFFSW